MIRKEITIGEGGLRSRPAAMLVQTAGKYPCRITMEYMGKRINAKSMMGVFSLGVMAGESVTLTAEGEGELEALRDIEALITGGFKGD